MANFNKQSLSRIFVILGLFVLIIIIYNLFNYFLHKNKMEVIVYSAIPDTTVKIDSEEVSNGGTFYLTKTKHQLTASKEGYVDYKSGGPEYSQAIEPSDNLVEVYIALKPASEEAKSFVANNPDVSKELDKAWQKFENERQSGVGEAYPFLQYLPLESRYYRVTAVNSAKYPDDVKKVALLIEASSAFGREGALNELKEKGVILTDQELIYSKFTNPFKLEDDKQ